MTDAWFLSNNSVTCKANHVVFETRTQVVGCIKAPKNCRNRSKGSPWWGNSLPENGNVPLLGPYSHPCAPIVVQFFVDKQTHVSLGHAKFHVNLCNESPMWGENADFWLVSKFNTGSLPHRGILPVKTCPLAVRQFVVLIPSVKVYHTSVTAMIYYSENCRLVLLHL